MPIKNVKSKYILEYIFSLIETEKFLSLILYNKYIMNQLSVSINDYKSINELKNKISKKLIYEGEYKYGRKNGKGKEYNHLGGLIFEGEYKDGKKNGMIKEYNKIGELIFEGEYKDDKKNGKGKEYNRYGELIFEGEYKNGKLWNGINKENKYPKYSNYLKYNEIFIGEYKMGKYWNGTAKKYYPNYELKFEKEYVNGKLKNAKHIIKMVK